MVDKGDKVLFNPFDVVEDASNSLDDFSPEVRVIFKRILKKENATRLRGLEELSRWLTTCNESSFIQLRPQFVGIYTSGVVDEERNIRELVNSCLLIIVEREKKWLSPVIKELFFPWIGSLNDHIASVARIALKALESCFGSSRYVDVCKVAGPVIMRSALDTIQGRKSSIVVAHAFQALHFIISHSDEETLMRLKNGNDFLWRDYDATIRVPYYKFLLVALNRNFVRENILNDTLFDVLLMDVRGGIATETTSLLCLFPHIDQDKIAKFTGLLKIGLPSEIPKATLSQLTCLLKKFPANSIAESIWFVIKTCKVFDLSRLLMIWRLLCSCLHEYSDAFYFKQALLPGIILEDIRSDVLLALHRANGPEFMTAYNQMMIDCQINDRFKLELTLDLPNGLNLNCNTLRTICMELSIEEKDTIIVRILRSSNLSEWHQLILDQLMADHTDISALLLSEELVSRLKLNDTYEYAIDQLVKKLPDYPVDMRVEILVRLLSFRPSPKVLVDQESVLYALNNLITDNACTIIMNYFGQNTDHYYNIKLIEPLAGLAKSAIEFGDQVRTRAFITFLNLLNESIASDLDKRSIAQSIEFLFDTSPSVHPHLLQAILHRTPELASNILLLFNRKNPDLFARMDQHLSEHSMALYSHPLLWTSDCFVGGLWEETLEFIDSLQSLFNFGDDTVLLTHEFITFSAFLQCLVEEQNYYTEPLLSTKQLLLPKLDSPNSQMVISKKGFYLVLAKQLGYTISIPKLLENEISLSLASLEPEKRTAEYSMTDLSDEQTIKLMGFPQAWTKDEQYQLLSNIPRKEFILKDPRHTYILANFVSMAVKARIDKDEYWMQYQPLLNTLIDTLPEYFNNAEDILKYHKNIHSLINLLSLPLFHQFVLRRIDSIWNCFKSILTVQPINALKPTVEAFTAFVMQLDPKLIHFATNEELTDLLFNGDFLSGKVACRKLLISRFDTILESARLELAEDFHRAIGNYQTFGSNIHSIIVPISSLRKALESKEQHVDFGLNNLFALDLFLGLVEGSGEELQLLNSYADCFKDQISSVYLGRLVELLDWNTDEPFDLSKLEFTIFMFDDSFDLHLYAANLLFRCYKAFPTIVSHWYSLLPKECSSRVLRYSTQFISPLLIERELSRLRKSSLDPIKLRIIKSSTICSVQVNYHLEEFQLSFSLTIPPTYPLSPMTLEGGERLGISETKWRAWLLTVRSLLSQNSAIIDAIRRWKINAEKVLQGIEPCSICYCVLQPGDKSLPGPSCKTCKNKFHSVCLYRWFKTGGQATCPMCRSLI